MTRIVYLRYIVASAGALGLDLCLFMAALAAGVPAVAASGLGYGAGIAAHWLLSSRAVFVGSLADPGRARVQQQLLFVATAIAGLLTTMAIVAAGGMIGADPRLSKLAAIAVSFQLTYLLRRRLVFA